MTKTLTQSTQQTPEEAVVRSYEPDEFEADTPEERPIALLAQKRRQFLAALQDHRHFQCRFLDIAPTSNHA